jgi:hypothetical protein
MCCYFERRLRLISCAFFMDPFCPSPRRCAKSLGVSTTRTLPDVSEIGLPVELRPDRRGFFSFFARAIMLFALVTKS